MATVQQAQPSLVRQFRRAERGRQFQAICLVGPLLVFLACVFVLPIAYIFYLSVASPEMREVLPHTSAELERWDGETLPGEEVFATLAKELATEYEAKTIAGIATRLNYEIPGFRSVVMRTARHSDKLSAPFREAMIERDEAWADISNWRVMRRAIGPLTPYYVLQVVDLERTDAGEIEQVPEARAFYREYLIRTFGISGSVTLLCLLIGYPIAYYAAHATSNWRYVVLGSVLLPFWISVLVRTAAWMIVLQKEGLINGTLISAGLIDQPMQLIFNRFSVYVAMVHVLLPFVVMPLYNNMRTIPPVQMKAAGSLGARPVAAFLSVYFPQTLPGLSAGALLVFILALGYYITPALVGGPGDQMLSFLVTQFALELGNWGMASASAGLLLICTFISYAAFRLILGARGFMA